MQPMEQASELNVYVILTRAVFKYIQVDGSQSEFNGAYE